MLVLAGLVPWMSASRMSLMRGSGCILENGNLIKKFAFPSRAPARAT